METENKTERLTWGSDREFIISLLGFSIGMGNLVRFSFLAYDNGGGNRIEYFISTFLFIYSLNLGAFLICYISGMILVGIPMFFMEVGLGQYYKEGMMTIWKIVPLFKGWFTKCSFKV